MVGEEPANKRLKSGHAEEDAAANLFLCEAQSVVVFHLLRSTTRDGLVEEMQTGGTEFEGEFFHQHFGEEEKIRGYQGLHVDIWFSAHTYHTWLDVKWEKRKPGADKVTQVLGEAFPKASASRNDLIDVIVDTLAKGVDLVQHGQVLARMDTAEEGELAFVIYQLAAESSAYVRELHERMEPLLLFFIDGASLIDNLDPKWELLLAVKQAQEGHGHVVLGMQTMYNFWAFPDYMRGTGRKGAAATAAGGKEQQPQQVQQQEQQQEQQEQQQQAPGDEVLDVKDFKRLRLSQVLILPPFQGLGLGKRMLQLAYKMAVDKNCLDLTLEDQSEQLGRVREKLEVEMMLEAPWLVEQLHQCCEAASSCGVEQEATSCMAMPASLLARITKELKIHKREARMVWEALLFIQPQLAATGSARTALESLIRTRIMAEKFGTCGAADEAKKVHEHKDGRGFIMMKTKKNAAVEVPAKGGGESSSVAAAGRLGVVMVPAEQKEEQIKEALDVRLDQLETLARLLRARGGAENGQRGEQSKAPVESKGSAHVMVDAV